MASNSDSELLPNQTMGSGATRHASRSSLSLSTMSLPVVVATPWFVFVAALAVINVVPLWLVEYLPFMDLPQHLATIAVMHHYDDPAFGFSAFFDLDLLSTPYLGYYLLVDLLAHLVPLETANRLVLSLCGALLPIAAWRYLAACGREPLLALLALPVFYNTFLFMGFLNFVMALPFMLFALGALLRYLASRRRIEFVWLTIHALLIFFAHPQVYLLYLGSASLYLILSWPGFKRMLLAASHIGPSLVIFTLWVLRSRILGSAEVWSESRGGRNVSPAGGQWEPLGVSLRELPVRLSDAYRDNSDNLLLVLLLFLIMVLLLVRRPRPDESGGSGIREFLRTNALELVSMALLWLYFALPVSYKWIWPLNARLVPVAFLVGLVWFRLPPLALRGRLMLAVPLAALALAGTANHTRQFLAFEREVGPLERVLEAAEPRRRLMGLIFDRGSEVMTPSLSPYIHFAQYYQLRRGGVADFSFANFPQSPIRFNERTAPPQLPLRWEWTPDRLRHPRYPPGVADYYDYYLVRGDWGARSPFGAHLGAGVREVKAAGRWRLFERVRD